jgi:transcription initiation factor TFIIH subunit 3
MAAMLAAHDEPTAHDASLLILVVDVNPTAWPTAVDAPHAPLSAVLEALCVFANAFRALRADNRLAVVACHAGRPTMLLRAGEATEGGLHATFVQALVAAAYNAPTAATSATSLAAALAIALCHARRHAPPDARRAQAQVLVALATADEPAQYNSLMNCIFAAQRARVLLDCVALRCASPFMQQAAHLTGGCYLQPDAAAQAALAPLLIGRALADRWCRRLLRPPRAHDVDFRAACFLTNRMLSVAWVCSVCLSPFETGGGGGAECESGGGQQQLIECPACRARFPPTRARGGGGGSGGGGAGGGDAARKRKRPAADTAGAAAGAAAGGSSAADARADDGRALGAADGGARGE